jgi:hypothetical protein
LESIRTENRIQAHLLGDRKTEIAYLRDRLEKLLHEKQVMSLVR